METTGTASCSTLRSSTSLMQHPNNKCHSICDAPQRNSHHFHYFYLSPSFSASFPKTYSHSVNKTNFWGTKFLHREPNKSFTALISPSDQNTSPQFAVLLEVDGVLIDAHRSGNRKAFNIAFQKLGLDCANWTEPVYLDLVRKSSTDEERMLMLYFNRIGWPTSVPTSEKVTFIKNILRAKKNALDEFLMSESSSLRPGVEDFIDDASREGVPVVILTASRKSEENVCRSIIDKLGTERLSKIIIVGNKEVERSLYGQLVLGKGVLSGLDEQLAKEARTAVSSEKQRIAEEVASMLKLTVEIDTRTSESLDKVVAALRAGAEYAGVPVSNCVLVAGSQSGVDGAAQIAMPCIVLRSSLTSRAEFPSAIAQMDGFGGSDLTISKLQHRQWS